MRIILSTLFAVAFLLTSCAPQTETRAHMDDTGNRMSDSIIKYIDSCLAQPGRELAGTGSPISFNEVKIEKDHGK